MIRWALLGVALLAGLGFGAEMAWMAVHPPVAVGDVPRHGWTVVWLVWLTLTVVSFAAIEGLALFNGTAGDTLTEHIEYIAGQSPFWTGTIGLGILAFFVWFAGHLFSEDSRVWQYLGGVTPGEAPTDPPDEESST